MGLKIVRVISLCVVETQADGAVILRGGIAEDCGPKGWINFGLKQLMLESM